MLMSLSGIVFGVSFFVITQAQTSGFQEYFIKTILGANGAIRISDRFQGMEGTVRKVSQNGKVIFKFQNRESAKYVEGIDYPNKIKNALAAIPSVNGISEVFEENANLSTKSRSQPIQLHGIKISDHLMVSDLKAQIIQGSISNFLRDKMGIIIGNKIAERLNLKINDRVNIVGKLENSQLRVSGIFESGISDIDKKRCYISLPTARSLSGKRFGGSTFQVGITAPEKAPQIAAQIQGTISHRAVSWQEREKVWLDVFKALRFSSAITVSCILLLSGLGMFNVFAIMVIEKTRDISILRSMGFTRADISSVFLWQGVIVLFFGIIGGITCGVLGTFIVSKIPMKIRGVLKSDTFVVNWDYTHYMWAVLIASLFVGLATWIPARRAAKIEPAKIIRETL